MILKKLFVKFNTIGNTNIFKPSIMTNSHCSWYYNPPITNECIKSINGRNYRLQKYTTNIDRKKLKSAFLPNYIQFCDADICARVNAIMKKANAPLLTIHDCFRCPYHFAHILDDAILKAYQDFYDSDYLTKHLLDANPQILEELNKIKLKYNIKTFTSSEITKTNLFSM